MTAPEHPTLRPYQERAIELLRGKIQDRPLLALPTGAGKTSVAADIIRRVVEGGRRAVFLVHRRELVDQAVDRLAQFGIKAGRILAGYPEARILSVQVASIPTLIRREHWPAALVVVDECAHAVSASWAKCLARYTTVDPDQGQDMPAWVIGLTATPIRLDGRGLGDLFGSIVEPVTTRELIEQGHLVEPVVYARPIDLAGIKTRGGDYALPELAECMDKFTGSITETWMQRARGQSTVVFAVNVDHSKRIVEAFQELGVRAEHIDGGTATTKREETLRKLRDGEIDMVSNCMVLSEGWDLPTLRCAILARPTKSLALFRQMVGRIMRPPGPVVVLDHANNHHEHGLVTDEIEWTLDSKQKREPVTSVRTCPECYAIVPPGVGECPQCGALVVSDTASSDPEEAPIHAPGELVRFKPRRAKASEKRARYRELVREANAFGRKLGWARHRYKLHFGVWPRGMKDIEEGNYHCLRHAWEETRYGVRCAQCYAPRVEAREVRAAPGIRASQEVRSPDPAGDPALPRDAH